MNSLTLGASQSVLIKRVAQENELLCQVKSSMPDFAVELCSAAELSVDNEFKFRNNPPNFVNTGVSIIAVFAPMAGLLTDLKYSRYKTVILCSSYFLLIEVVLLFMAVIILFSLVVANGVNYVRGVPVGIVLVLAGIIHVTLLVFLINSIRFGMDQLHDSPTEDSILFIHWYVWIQYFCSFITNLNWNLPI